MMNTLKLLNRWTVAASLAILAACGGGGGGGGISPPMGTNNTIVATPSPTGPISVAVGQSQAFSVTFTTSDGKTATNFSITSGLSTLPAGWTGPTSLACASVSTGNGCMANLTFTPTAASTGAVTFNYSYVNNAGTSKTGTATVSYSSTSNDNVVATPSPAGPIAVVTGGHSTVGITFTTDDGAMATGLSITSGLSTLPPGWSGPATFTCASVSTGSGCVLNVTYAPTAVANSALVLNYAYKNNSGTAKTGSISISYSATTQNHVIGTTTPAGQIVAVIGGAGQTVKVDFTTDDSNPATNLAVTPANLTSLPAGWTGPATFTCKTVSTGNGCQLSLTYAPTQAGSGTFPLSFGYTNNSGVAATGTVNISYMASADNTVIATQSPSGTVNGVVGAPSQAVTVTFNSSDSNPVSNVAITSGLSTLPAGWSGPATFTCASASNTGNGCQLSLAYAPPAAASGSLQLNYSFQAHSGTTKTGSVTILFVATTHNILSATQDPSGPIGAVVNSGSVPVTLTFTTNDGNPATAVTITSDLSTLPPGWSSPVTGTGTVICASASTGTGCQLMLTYAPTVNGSGSLALGYSYLDDSGTPQTGTASIAYASIPGFLYITDLVGNVISCAVSGVDGSLSFMRDRSHRLYRSRRTDRHCVQRQLGLRHSGRGSDRCRCLPGLPRRQFGHMHPRYYVWFTERARRQRRLPVRCRCQQPQPVQLPDQCGRQLGYVHPRTTSALSIRWTALPSRPPMPTSSTTTADNLSTCTVSSIDGSLSACSQQTLNGTDPAGGNTPSANPSGVSVYGGNLYIGTNAGVLILPIARMAR